MSDLEQFKALLDSWGVVYEVEDSNHEDEPWVLGISDVPGKTLTLENDGGKLIGQGYAEFLFDENGKFVQAGLWE